MVFKKNRFIRNNLERKETLQSEKIFVHNLSATALIHLEPYIQRHSGDVTICYKTVGSENLCLSLYFPPQYSQETEETFPIFVMVHGGGWSSRKVFADQTNWAGDYLGYLARYYADKGFVAVSVDYRMLDGNNAGPLSLMDLYEDCMDALVFLWENREQYHLDLECACLLGESAGGYLAAAMLTFPYRKSPFRFQRGILVNPITDLLDSKWGKYLSSDINKNNDDENRRCLSPLWQISADVCPILLMHGTEDHTVSLSHSQEFYRRMQMAQRYTELHLFEHTGHAFLLAEYSRKIAAVSEAIGVIDSFIQADSYNLRCST